MKGIIKLALAAALAAGVSAQPHQHRHSHRHLMNHDHAGAHAEKRDLEKRETYTVTSVVPATVTSYELDGQEIDASAAVAGISEGLFVVMGSSTPTLSVATTSSTSTSISTTSSSSEAAQFIEIAKASSTSTTSSSSTSSTPSTSSTSTSTSTSVSSSASSSSSSSSTSSASIDTDFPSGEISCSTFPSAYGAVALDWLDMDGWSGLQDVGSWTSGVSISSIVEPTSGGCESGYFCSYACPAGYQKTQWPEDSQGSSGQSIGGLWCNDDGYLEIVRSTHPTICEEGAGGVYVENKMSSATAAVCRTDYPGTENMVIPLNTEPGNTYPLTNPNEATYYEWEGKTTSAQYYVNPQNVAVDDACVWTSSTNPDSAGNWAPINIGVGMDDTGTTYISIFANSPTSSATLDFDIEITGDVSSECYYKSGSYAGGSTGCTTAISSSGGTATIVFTDSS